MAGATDRVAGNPRQRADDGRQKKRRGLAPGAGRCARWCRADRHAGQARPSGVRSVELPTAGSGAGAPAAAGRSAAGDDAETWGGAGRWEMRDRASDRRDRGPGVGTRRPLCLPAGEAPTLPRIGGACRQARQRAVSRIGERSGRECRRGAVWRGRPGPRAETDGLGMSRSACRVRPYGARPGRPGVAGRGSVPGGYARYGELAGRRPAPALSVRVPTQAPGRPDGLRRSEGPVPSPAMALLRGPFAAGGRIGAGPVLRPESAATAHRVRKSGTAPASGWPR